MRALPAALLLLLIPGIPPLLGAQSPPEPRLVVETFPENPVSGAAWTLTLLVDYPRPGELEVSPPPFPPALTPESSRREPRLVGTERWTALEYRFILQGSGTLTLPPFEITGPWGTVRSAPLSLNIQGAAKAAEAAGAAKAAETRIQLVWEQIPPRISAGEALEFSLRIPGWGSRPLPDPALLLPPVPPGCIMEALEPRPGDAEAGRVLRLRLIPLSGGEFSLPAKTVRSGNYLLELPPLRIPVAPPGASRKPEGRP
jgi:hypothetical protein